MEVVLTFPTKKTVNYKQPMTVNEILTDLGVEKTYIMFLVNGKDVIYDFDTIISPDDNVIIYPAFDAG